MIEELHGRRETVLHPATSDFRLYMNIEAENYPAHWHTDLEIIMPIENIYTAVLEKQSYCLAPDDILIIPSGEIHELIAPPRGRRLIFQVDHAILREVNGFDSISNKFYPCALFREAESPDVHKHMKELLFRIYQEYTEAEPLFEANIHALVIAFFVQAGRLRLQQTDSFGSMRRHKQQSYIDTFFNLCTYMNEHCTEELSLDELADMAGFSKSHFIRLFKEFAGVSYYEYLTKRRLLHAELLLDNPQYSIADIAMQSGFNSLATFNRVFKASHDCTPTDYRKRQHTNAS